MRARYVIGVVAVILISFGMKMFFFSALTAEANAHMKNLAMEATPHTDANQLEIGAPPYP